MASLLMCEIVDLRSFYVRFQSDTYVLYRQLVLEVRENVRTSCPKDDANVVQRKESANSPVGKRSALLHAKYAAEMYGTTKRATNLKVDA